ncbi:SIR3 deacetylase, partial [Polypterus senegalus]
MSALGRHLKVLSGTLVRSRVLPKASITSKPPKEVITPAVSGPGGLVRVGGVVEESRSAALRLFGLFWLVVKVEGSPAASRQVRAGCRCCGSGRLAIPRLALPIVVDSPLVVDISPPLAPPPILKPRTPLPVRLYPRRTRPLSTSPSKCHLFGKSSEPQTLDDVVSLLKRGDCKRVIVMAGAGISTPSGIPDFRSPGSGLYDNLQQYDIPYPEAIFDIHYFHQNPRPFFTLAKELYPGNYLPNSAHYFVRLLHMKGLLQRMYTQNIDGLERLAGVPPDKLVEAHGTFASATCTTCQKSYAGEDLKVGGTAPVCSQSNVTLSCWVSRVFQADIFADRIPKCATCRGVIKPDIVFFGEELPQRFLLFLTDFPLADLLIIMGTSLEVEPFASLAGSVRSSVTRVLINRDAVGPFASPSCRFNDVLELGDVIGGVEKCVDKLGWKAELDALMAAEIKKVP